MHTFYEMWGVKTPEEAKRKIEEQRQAAHITEPKNLEEQAISLVGEDLYHVLIKGYTEKQWGRSCKELPTSIIRRLPVRFTFDSNYFNDPYQGIPIGGYTALVGEMLKGIDVRLKTDYFQHRAELNNLAKKIIFTGPIDAYFDYQLGPLNYRSIRFETERLATENFQGVAVVNYTEQQIPFTRIIEHKHFVFGNESPSTIISREYPSEWKVGEDPYYPINDALNTNLYDKYKLLASHEKKLFFGGRLGAYRYYDMDKVISEALIFCDREFSV